VPTTVVAADLMAVTAGIRRVVRRRLRRDLHPALPPAQVDLLLVVEAEPGIGVAAAARTLHLAGNSVSALVNVLVDGGFLRRETDPADRRAAKLYPTEAAARRLVGWRSARAELVGRAFERLDAADREAITRAVPALHRLLDELFEGAAT
jgi:DNA-binding MarR family transcriptional regulator